MNTGVKAREVSVKHLPHTSLILPHADVLWRLREVIGRSPVNTSRATILLFIGLAELLRVYVRCFHENKL